MEFGWYNTCEGKNMSDEGGENMPIEHEPGNNNEAMDQEQSENNGEEQELDRRVFTDQEARAVVEELSRVTQSLAELSGVLQGVPDAQNNIADALRTYADVQKKIYEATEAQLPQELRMPTKRSIAEEVAEREGRDFLTQADIDSISDEEYLEEIEDWFGRRFRDHEARTETYEERSESLTQLISAIVRLEYDPKPEFRKLGQEYKKQLEVRRSLQRIARVWSLSTPDQIEGSSYVMTIDTFKELFTMEGVAEAYQEYVRMGDDLAGTRKNEMIRINKIRNEEKRKKEKRKVDEALDQKTDKILNFFNHGGEVSYENAQGEQETMNLDEAIDLLKAQDVRSDNQERLLANSEKILQARKIAGRLASITLEAADKNYGLLDTGDYLAKRVVRFNENIEDGYTKKTQGIWENFDFGFKDFITSIVEEDRDGKLVINGVEIDSKEKFIENIGRRQLWEKIQKERIVAENYYSSTTMFRFNKANETRSTLYEFLKDPNLARFIELGNAFKHIPAKAGKDKGARNTEAAQRQIKLRELLDSIIQFGYSKAGAGVLEDYHYFKSAEAALWIQQADNNEMITTAQRNSLMNKHVRLKIPIPGMSQEEHWELAVSIDFYNAFNKNKKWRDYMELEIRRKTHEALIEQIRNYWKT